jgi:hypothetical protein
MISGLQEVDPIISHQIDDPMFLRESSRPDACVKVLERLRFAESVERITHDGLDQLQDAQSDLPVLLYPILEILSKLILKDGDALLILRQVRPRNVNARAMRVFPSLPGHAGVR